MTGFRLVGNPQSVPLVVSEIHDMPITFATYERFADRYGIAGERFERFVHLLTAMDDEYLAVLAERRAGNTTSDNDESDDGP